MSGLAAPLLATPSRVLFGSHKQRPGALRAGLCGSPGVSPASLALLISGSLGAPGVSFEARSFFTGSMQEDGIQGDPVLQCCC